MSNLHVDFNAPLNELDSEMRTYGYRQNNPDIYGSIFNSFNTSAAKNFQKRVCN